jgi:Tat protein translocase TatB subunit
MFGIGTGELLVILVVALIIIGPNKLPEIARVLGKGLAEFRKAADDLKYSVTKEANVEEEKRKLVDIQSSQVVKAPDGQEVNKTEGEQIQDETSEPAANPTNPAVNLPGAAVNQIEEKGDTAQDAEKKQNLL